MRLIRSTSDCVLPTSGCVSRNACSFVHALQHPRILDAVRSRRSGPGTGSSWCRRTCRLSTRSCDAHVAVGLEIQLEVVVDPQQRDAGADDREHGESAGDDPAARGRRPGCPPRAVRKRSSTPALRSRSASRGFGGRSIERTAGMTVISMTIVASTPQPAKTPKCCTIGMPVPASDRKVMTAIEPGDDHHRARRGPSTRSRPRDWPRAAPGLRRAGG